MRVDVPGYSATKKPDEKGRGGGGGGQDWSGGTSGSGSNSAKEQKRYMQAYLQVIYRLYGNRRFSEQQQKLANYAFRMRWAASTYGEMLRREDPMFVRSQLYKDRAQQARDLYQLYRPGRPVPHGFITAYARSSMNKARLQERIEKSRWFRREFAGWTEAQKAGSPAGMSPQTFINYRTLWNNALQNYAGRPATREEQRLMFSAGMTGDEVANNLVNLFGGQEALRWATGQDMTPQQIIKAALTNKFGRGAYNKVAQQVAQQGNFMQSQLRPFDIGVDEETGQLTSSRI